MLQALYFEACDRGPESYGPESYGRELWPEIINCY